MGCVSILIVFFLGSPSGRECPVVWLAGGCFRGQLICLCLNDMIALDQGCLDRKDYMTGRTLRQILSLADPDLTQLARMFMLRLTQQVLRDAVGFQLSYQHGSLSRLL